MRGHKTILMVLIGIGLGALIVSGCQTAPKAKICKPKTLSSIGVAFQIEEGTPTQVSLSPRNATVVDLLFQQGIYELRSGPIFVASLPEKLPVPECLVQVTRLIGGELVTLTGPLALAGNSLFGQLPLRNGDSVTLVNLHNTSLKEIKPADFSKGRFTLERGGAGSISYDITRALSRIDSLPGIKVPEPDDVIAIERVDRLERREIFVLPLVVKYVGELTILQYDTNRADKTLFSDLLIRKAPILPEDNITIGKLEEIPRLLAFHLNALSDNLTSLRRANAEWMRGMIGKTGK
jgi:hypothetical protein